MTPSGAEEPLARAQLCRLLLAHAVDLIVIGGAAIQAHGIAHATSDLDVLCRGTTANLERPGRALAAVGAHARGRPEEYFAFPDDVPELIVFNTFAFDTRYGALDVLKWAPNAWDFDAVRRRAEHLPVGDIVVPVAHLDDLIAMKRLANRPNDRAVLPALLQRQRRREEPLVETRGLPHQGRRRQARQAMRHTIAVQRQE